MSARNFMIIMAMAPTNRKGVKLSSLLKRCNILGNNSQSALYDGFNHHYAFRQPIKGRWETSEER